MTKPIDTPADNPFANPTPTESQAIQAAQSGQRLQFAPDTPKAEKQLRAELVRALALSEHTHPKGVRIDGAIITGLVDLDYCTVPGRLSLTHCKLPDGLSALDATIAALDLSGSTIGAVSIDGTTIQGDLVLADEFRAKSTVTLRSSSIQGDLSCIHASFAGGEEPALAAEYLRVSGVFYWRNVSVESGAVVLTGASVDALADDLKSWPKAGKLMIDGFTYERIVYGDTSAQRRLEWLAKHASNDFQPQPYQQFARVVGDMGHRHDKSRVLMEMEAKLRVQQRKDIRAGGGQFPKAIRPAMNEIRARLHWLWDGVLRYLVGYGYRPWWALWWALPMVVLTTFLYQKVWDAGDFAPNHPPALMSAGWQNLATNPMIENPAAIWSCTPPSGADPSEYPCQSQQGRDYETFKAPLYALDLFVPLIALGQDGAWAPSTSRGRWGRVAHNLQIFIKTLGWVITALVAGAVAGVIRND